MRSLIRDEISASRFFRIANRDWRKAFTPDITAHNRSNRT